MLLLSLCTTPPVWAARCLFVSSYHQGYSWSDGIERGVRSVLEGRCELQLFHMDAKRYKEPQELAQKALEAKAFIDTWHPDVVITADDDVAQYLIMPYYKDHTLPFVFCGINWTVKEYGFPYRNVTGMVEVAPVEPLLDQAMAILKRPGRGFYLGANTSTERKNLGRTQQVAARRGVPLTSRLVDTMADWLDAFRYAQRYDFIILGNNASINDWQAQQVLEGLRQSVQRLVLTNVDWMMPYAMIGLTKIPEEQGEWAAKTALHILQGTSPATIPIVPNRKWDIWINPLLVETAGIHLPQPLRQKAKKVNAP